jgi:hypothetical protein
LMRPFGTGPAEIASYDLAALMRRVEARRMERERRELARRERWARVTQLFSSDARSRADAIMGRAIVSAADCAGSQPSSTLAGAGSSAPAAGITLRADRRARRWAWIRALVRGEGR